MRYKHTILREVPLLGRTYAVGEELDDPRIKPEELASLQRLGFIDSKAVEVQEDGPLAEVAAEAMKAQESLDREAVKSLADEPSTSEPEPEDDEARWRAAWEAASAAAEGQAPTFRQFLVSRAEAEGVSGAGSTKALIERLTKGEIAP